MKIKGLSEIENESSIYISVSFDESEAIMQDEQMVKNAFCIHYDTQHEVATLLNEGFPCDDYSLDQEEISQVKTFVQKLNSTTTVQVSDTTGDK